MVGKTKAELEATGDYDLKKDNDCMPTLDELSENFKPDWDYQWKLVNDLRGDFFYHFGF